SNLVYACAFSPDDRRLAFAGGDAQAITLVDLGGPDRPRIELTGQGSAIWDVGFGRDSRAVGFARRRPDLPDPPREYEDFGPPGAEGHAVRAAGTEPRRADARRLAGPARRPLDPRRRQRAGAGPPDQSRQESRPPLVVVQLPAPGAGPSAADRRDRVRGGGH